MSDEEATQIRQQDWSKSPEYQGLPLLVGKPGQWQLGKRADGSCVFLLASGRCAIHEQHGAAAKPLTCQMFPLQLVPHEKQAVLTLRRACPSAAADEGRELADHLPAARQLAALGELATMSATAPTIKPGEPSDWKRARIVLAALGRLTCQERFPPVVRLVQGLEFCRILEQAQTKGFDNNKFAQLCEVLETNIADEAAVHFSERQPPLRASSVLFRQMALELVRLHPTYQVATTWRTRFQFAWWAWRMVRGTGELPKVHPHFPPATFAALEAPLGRLDSAIYQPLFRYLETTVTSWQYALVNKQGWSLLESYRQLAIFYPLALWILRWATAGRTPVVDDMVQIVAMLDRAQGYDPLSGSKQRNRLATLARLSALPALVAWYGR